MRTWIAVLALAVAPSFGAARDLGEIQARGTLKVLTVVDEEPEMFNFRAGEPGFERELVEGFASLHKLKVESVVIQHFEDIIPALLKEEGDLITGIIDTDARHAKIDFTVEVLPARHVIVNRKPRPPITTLEEFRKEKVGVLKGSSWATAAAEAGVPPEKSEPYPDRASLLDALKTEKIGATVMSVSDMTLMMRRQPELQAGLFLGKPGSAGWGVRKKDTALLAALNSYLGDVRKGQTWSRLVVKYFGADALPVLKSASKE
jgi:membrane-bound lytic murein transglycosylase F